MPHLLRAYSGTILPKSLKHASLLEDILVLCSQWQFFSTRESSGLKFHVAKKKQLKPS